MPTIIDKQKELIKGLLSGWLRNAEDRVEKYYGITATPNQSLLLAFSEMPISGESAIVSAERFFKDDKQVVNMLMSFDINFYYNNLGDKPGSGQNLNARFTAHEVTHAVMLSALYTPGYPIWFHEGTAEFIHGADYTVRSAIGTEIYLAHKISFNPKEKVDYSDLKVQKAITDIVASTPDSKHSGFIEWKEYAASYLAVKYLHQYLKDKGYKDGIKAFIQNLKKNNDIAIENGDLPRQRVSGKDIFDASLKELIGLTGDEFVAKFRKEGTDFKYYGIELNNDDTGAIGGYDADGGPQLDFHDVLSARGDSWSEQPLKNFRIIWDTDRQIRGTELFSKEAIDTAIRELRAELPELVHEGKGSEAETSITDSPDVSESGSKDTTEIQTSTPEALSEIEHKTTATQVPKSTEKTISVPTVSDIERIEISKIESPKLESIKASIVYLGIAFNQDDQAYVESLKNSSNDFEGEAFKHLSSSSADPRTAEINSKIQRFNESPAEFDETHKNSLLNDIYLKLFGRNLDKEGQEYWTKVADNLANESKLEKLPFYVLDGAKLDDSKVIENKIKFLTLYHQKLLDGFKASTSNFSIDAITSDPNSVVENLKKIFEGSGSVEMQSFETISGLFVGAADSHSSDSREEVRSEEVGNFEEISNLGIKLAGWNSLELGTSIEISVV